MNENTRQITPSETDSRESDSSASTAVETAQSTNRRSLFGWIVLLLILLAVSAFGYYQQYLEFTALQNQISELQKSVRGLDNHPTLVELKQRIIEQDNKLNASLAQQREQIQALDQAFDVTKNTINRDQSGWVLAEVEYLLRLAVVRLRLMHDIKGSIEALIVADTRLGDLADPAMLEVREILANEVTALKSLATPDVEGVGLQLLGMSNRLHLLPAAKRPVSSNLLDDPALTESAEETFFAGTWNNFKRRIGLRRTDAPVGTAILQAELYYVEQKIRLELEYARQAALRLDKDAIDRHLAATRSLIETHYDRDHQQVITLRAELAALQEADLIPALPDISGSLRKLRELQQKYRPLQPVESETTSEEAS